METYSAASVPRIEKIPFNQALATCKFLAIVLVVCLHGGPAFFGRGYLAVDFFFIVSGMFLANSVLADGSSTFNWLKNKVLKIYPVYVSAILTLLFLNFLGNIIHGRGVLDFFKKNWNVLYELFFLQRVGFTTYIINIADWYISAMLFTGIFLHFVFSKYHETIIPLLFIAIIISLAYLVNRSGHIDQHSTIVLGTFDVSTFRAFAGMSTGIILHSIIQKSKNIEKKATANCIEVVALLMLISFMFMPHGRQHRSDILIYPIFCVIIFSCFKCKGIISQFLENKIFKFVSKYELALYLTHIIVITYDNKVFGKYWNFQLRFVACCMFAVIFHHLVYGCLNIIQTQIGLRSRRASVRGAS